MTAATTTVTLGQIAPGQTVTVSTGNGAAPAGAVSMTKPADYRTSTPGFDLEVWRTLLAEQAKCRTAFNETVLNADFGGSTNERMFQYSHSMLEKALARVRTVDEAVEWYRAEYLDEISPTAG